MWNTLPQFGTGVLCAILVAAAYTFAVSLAAGAGRPRLLQAARKGAYGTVALVGLAVLVLAYAFVSHDYRLDYVARYSDRTMTTAWQIAALWGGQDGSLLWWLFLTAVFSGSCVAWLKGRYRDLQPYVIATQMSVLIFMAIIMLFAANPFRTLVAGAPLDGAGLNYQLRNFYMIIHPPSLYIGFTSCVVPFSFAIAALVTNRLDDEWIIATRKWMLFAWLFLSIGNGLGMGWAYEELGWGGYWAWDPVENAAFFPWLTASAYVHSVMIQERRGMMKMWNMILICLTFFLTYFGTFLTRSGLIASVHSFAQSGIGIFFVYYMVFIIAVCVTLIALRHRELRSEGRIDSPLSREFAFLLNNWVLLFMLVFIVTATVWPRISEWLLNQEATLSPPFFNMFVPLLGLTLIFLMGTAPLLGWRKTSKELFYRSFRFPVGTAVVALVLHQLFGYGLGFPPFVEVEPLANSQMWRVMAWVQGKLPWVTVGLVAYNLAVVAQEFYRGVRARRLKKKESVLGALRRLVAKSQRRYGGYVVHVGIAIMFLGFAGRNWETETEASMAPGETLTIAEYELAYVGPRTTVDHEKRIVFADMNIKRHGKDVGTLHPAKFIYKATPGQPSTEVARHMTLRNDLYVTVGIINTQSKVASVRVHVNTLVSFVPFGIIILMLGAGISMFPNLSYQQHGAFGYVKAVASVATMVMLSVLLALIPSMAAPSTAHGAQQQDMQRKGVVEQTKKEKALFKQLLCNCGSCPHEPLSSCTCGWAHSARDEVRAKLKEGIDPETIYDEYKRANGGASVLARTDKGADQLVWALPLVAGMAGAGLLFAAVRRWNRQEQQDQQAQTDGQVLDAPHDEYDDKLDAQLEDLE